MKNIKNPWYTVVTKKKNDRMPRNILTNVVEDIYKGDSKILLKDVK